MIWSFNKQVLSNNDKYKPISNRNNGSKLVFEKNDGNSEVNRFGNNGIEHVKK